MLLLDLFNSLLELYLNESFLALKSSLLLLDEIVVSLFHLLLNFVSVLIEHGHDIFILVDRFVSFRFA